MTEYCDGCPAKLLVGKGDNHKNIGNITSSSLFVLPKYDIEAINDLEEIYNQATGRLFEEHCNLTYAIRCTPKGTYDVFNDSIQHCKYNYFTDWLTHDYKHMFLFGSAWQLYYKDKPDQQHISFKYGNNYYYLHLYHSLKVKLFNSAIYEMMKDQLVQDIQTLNI